MTKAALFQTEQIEFSSQRGSGAIALLRKAGGQPPLVFMHGFGSIKEDYADTAFFYDGLKAREILVWDAPGFGKSMFSPPEAIDMDLHLELAEKILARLDGTKFHLAGHSMGGLTALLYACRHPERLLSLTSIEGNLAPEDCIYSRRICDFPGARAEKFLEWFQEQITAAQSPNVASFAARLPFMVNKRAVPTLFHSLVDYSDNGALLDRFLALSMPRLFVHGDENSGLSYIGRLQAGGIDVLSISHSGHFPMASNPPEMWTGLAGFLKRAEQIQK